ncbi:MAG: MarR family winged helix-turn-helix transcriptional regulator [Chloroflexota bacterium]|nr:MarR family winged helix-turn-helix transcriptional regulator [Chloroflexota bacterium]
MGREGTLLDTAHALIEGVPRMARLMRQDLRKHSDGLFTEPQFRVMALLYRDGPHCFSRLAAHQGVSLPTISKLVQGLEERGLIMRERDSADRRRVLLRLTVTGKVAYETLLRCTESHIVNWISDLSVEECAEVTHAFNLITARFREVCLAEFYAPK